LAAVLAGGCQNHNAANQRFVPNKYDALQLGKTSWPQAEELFLQARDNTQLLKEPDHMAYIESIPELGAMMLTLVSFGNDGTVAAKTRFELDICWVPPLGAVEGLSLQSQTDVPEELFGRPYSKPWQRDVAVLSYIRKRIAEDTAPFAANVDVKFMQRFISDITALAENSLRKNQRYHWNGQVKDLPVTHQRYGDMKLRMKRLGDRRYQISIHAIRGRDLWHTYGAFTRLRYPHPQRAK